MWAQRNSAVTQQSGHTAHAPRSGPEIKNVSFVVWEDVGVLVGIVVVIIYFWFNRQQSNTKIKPEKGYSNKRYTL